MQGSGEVEVHIQSNSVPSPGLPDLISCDPPYLNAETFVPSSVWRNRWVWGGRLSAGGAA
jgi:hypothetical protein